MLDDSGRVDSLPAIRARAREYRNIQEVIVQNSGAADRAARRRPAWQRAATYSPVTGPVFRTCPVVLDEVVTDMW